jgi:hypothetical protein
VFCSGVCSVVSKVRGCQLLEYAIASSAATGNAPATGAGML